MTIIEQIKAEIERRINELDISDESTLIEAELSELLSFISALELEKPEADLEKEIEISIRLLNGLHTFEDNKSWYKGRYEELKELARNFYDLGCRRTAEKYDELEYNRQRAEESEKPMNPNELEKEIEEYFPESTFNTGFNYDDLQEIARHFAEWQKEQMMKEAVEGDVIVPIYEGNDIWSTEIKIPGRYGYGDKVHIIIVKED